jgi:hypothetical protein
MILLLFLATMQGAPAPDVGPSVGQSLPAFEAPDQDGRERSSRTLPGPKGLVLLFIRSADW